MDEEDDRINICSELWNDLEPYSPCIIKFSAPITTGFRFRYQSEIEKKSYSLLKAEKNSSPSLEIITTECDTDLVVELITADGQPHFNMLYEVPKDKLSEPLVRNGILNILLRNPDSYVIKLDLGIRKMKNKEAMIRIKELYPKMKDADAKSFFNKNKDIVRLKATCYNNDIPACCICSDIIKSQISKENKIIKIKHFAPKVVADIGEQLIIVLEKKITTEEYEAFISIESGNPIYLTAIEQDGQTFVFNLPHINCPNSIDGKFTMRCGDNFDMKPIRFLPIQTEPRKRKNYEPHMAYALPLKRQNKSEHNVSLPLYPESMSAGFVETDCIQHLNTTEDTLENGVENINNRNDNDSCKDSGIHSDDRFQDNGDSTSSMDESDDDCIETEGFRSRKSTNIEPMKVLNVPAVARVNDSHLDINISNNATKKILSEVARIGHDFAFGKKPDELFERIEKQLPVVFTLQDDVGDTPLNNAILKGNVEHAFKILNIVRSNCEWALDLVNSSGHSALILAPACDVPPELIEKLLNANCKLDLWDDTGKSAITYAIEYQNVKALQVLLKHAQSRNLKSVVSRYGSNYYTPLQIAIMNKFTAGVEMLLNLKDFTGHNYLVNVNETGLMNDETALHIAVSHESDIQIIEMLLKRTDLNVNKPLSNQTTALHIASRMKHSGIINLLKQFNAIDLPNTDVEMQESDEECEEMEDADYPLCDSVQPESNINPTSNANRTINMITNSLKELSLKGEVKMKFIDILMLSTGPTLTLEELQQVVKPSFKSLFNKYGKGNTNKKDICELLDRFNCLPNSGGQLIDKLREIGRNDLVKKIKINWVKE